MCRAEPPVVELRISVVSAECHAGLRVEGRRSCSGRVRGNQTLRVHSGTETGRLYLVHDLYLGGAR